MKQIIIILLGLGTMSLGKLAVAGDIEMFGCENCSYSEARSKALQESTPMLQCFPPNNQTEITIDNQECFSQPRTYYVYVRNTQQIYGFNLYHTNQGGTPFGMSLQVDDFTPSSEITNRIEDAMAIYESRLAILSEIAEQLSENFTSPEQLQDSMNANSFSSFQMSTSSEIQCARSGAYNAVKDAFSTTLKQTMFDRANEYYQTLAGGEFGDFQNMRLIGGGASMQIRGVGFNASIEYIDGFQFIERRYSWIEGVVDPANFQPSRVTFKLALVDGVVQVEVDDNFTQIDGVSLASMKDQFATIDGGQVLSVCARDALDEYFPDSTSEPVNGGGTGGGTFPNPGAGGGGGGLPIGGGGGSSDLCRQHYYINGVRVLTVMVPCP